MTDVKVEQCDWEKARRYRGQLGHWTLGDRSMFETLAEDFARHRQAAEKAQQERDAAYIEGKGGVIPGAVVFASLVSGNSMPCMSGDPRDRMTAYRRRQFDDATHALATAIRSHCPAWTRDCIDPAFPRSAVRQQTVDLLRARAHGGGEG